MENGRRSLERQSQQKAYFLASSDIKNLKKTSICTVFSKVGEAKWWFYTVFSKVGEAKCWFYIVFSKVGEARSWFYTVFSKVAEAKS